MPLVAHLYPGAGVTPWSVRDLPLAWWLVFGRGAIAHAEAVKKQDREARRGR